MRLMGFLTRVRRELLRDPLNVAFGLGFPLVVLLLLTAIQANIPVSLFELENIAPGMCVFGLSFISLFSATLISKDRASSFMMRLLASPLRASEFIMGYTLPLIPMALCQSAICMIASVILGLPLSWNILGMLVTMLPAAVFFIALGLLFGSIFNDKQVGGICGALLTNLSAWLSGTWFDLSMVGGAFEKIARLLPFAPSVDAGRAALAGDWENVFPNLWYPIGYAVVIFAVAVLVFRRKMRE